MLLNKTIHGATVAIAALIKAHWLVAYLGIGIAFFIYVLAKHGLPEDDWINASSGPAPKTGIYGLFWGCTAFWPILLIGALLSAEVKRRLFAATMMLTVVAIVFLPIVIVVRLLWSIFFT
jgi:hypothetical protein